MKFTKKELDGFNYIVNEIFTPVINECKNEIDQALHFDQELQLEIEKEIELIMKNRMMKKIAATRSKIVEDTSKELSFAVNNSYKHNTSFENKVQTTFNISKQKEEIITLNSINYNYDNSIKVMSKNIIVKDGVGKETKNYPQAS